MIKIESNRVELKQELNEKLERSVVAFLNTNMGGLIYIGVGDDGKAVGVPDIDLAQRQIADRIKNNISPPVLGLFDVAVEKLDGIPIIKVIVSSGMEKPYYIKNLGRSERGCFIRIGSSVLPMTTQMIDDLYMRHRPVALGNIPAPRKELTFEQLGIYYQAKKLKLNEQFKTSLELLTPDGNDNFLAYMLADENGVSIKVAKYAGTNKVNLVENYEYGYCCLIKAAHQVLDRLDVENRIFAKITHKERIEKQMFDRTALREAVINAIVHNDYSRNAVPTVEIFSDRITVTSYGGLPPGLSRESFFACCSMPRNRELMRVFRDVGLVEQLGSGMGRILDVYDQTIFKFTGDFLIATFPFAEGYDPVNVIENDTINDKINEKINENDKINDKINENDKINDKINENGSVNSENGTINGGNGTINGVINGENGTVNGTVNENGTINGGNDTINGVINGENGTINGGINENGTINIINANPTITVPELVELTGKSRRTVLRELKLLQESGLLRREGSRKTGKWIVKSKEIKK